MFGLQRTRYVAGGLDCAGSPEEERTRWTGEQADQATLVATCRDVLWVVSSEEGIDYGEDLGPVIAEAAALSQPLAEVWTDRD